MKIKEICNIDLKDKELDYLSEATCIFNEQKTHAIFNVSIYYGYNEKNNDYEHFILLDLKRNEILDIFFLESKEYGKNEEQVLIYNIFSEKSGKIQLNTLDFNIDTLKNTLLGFIFSVFNECYGSLITSDYKYLFSWEYGKNCVSIFNTETKTTEKIIIGDENNKIEIYDIIDDNLFILSLHPNNVDHNNENAVYSYIAKFDKNKNELRIIFATYMFEVLGGFYFSHKKYMTCIRHDYLNYQTNLIEDPNPSAVWGRIYDLETETIFKNLNNIEESNGRGYGLSISGLTYKTVISKNMKYLFLYGIGYGEIIIYDFKTMKTLLNIESAKYTGVSKDGTHFGYYDEKTKSYKVFEVID